MRLCFLFFILNLKSIKFQLNSADEIFYLDEYYRIIQKQPPRGVLRKRCSENIQQIYRRTPMLKCHFNKAALQLY